MSDFDGNGDYISVPDTCDLDWPKEEWWMRGPFRDWNGWTSDNFSGHFNFRWSNPIRRLLNAIGSAAERL